jgi:hypothetical protein
VRVEWIGSDALNVVYRGANGVEVLLYRDSEPTLELLQAITTLPHHFTPAVAAPIRLARGLVWAA